MTTKYFERDKIRKQKFHDIPRRNTSLTTLTIFFKDLENLISAVLWVSDMNGFQFLLNFELYE